MKQKILLAVIAAVFVALVGCGNNYDTYDYDHSYDDDYGEGYGYDSSDPFYSSNDHNNDGLLTDEEWFDSMEDAIDYYGELLE